MMTGPYCHHLMVITQICNYAFSIVVYGNTHNIQSSIIGVVLFFDHNRTEY